MMTRQEIFDRAFTGLTRQNFERASADGKCVYRLVGKRTLKCAMGHCIPDDLYDPRMDAGSQEPGTGSGFAKACMAAGIPENDWAWARNLQQCHDRAHNPTEMLKNLIYFAYHAKLHVPVDLDSPWAQEAIYIYKDVASNRGKPYSPLMSHQHHPAHAGYPDMEKLFSVPAMYMPLEDAGKIFGK